MNQMTATEFKFEVAFSFLQQDEKIAFDINDHVADRLSTFIYSKRQEELGGTDGELTFNKVFREQSRIVVVLFREGWGQTSWTRIEETAIKNRAFEKGWAFLLIVNLDSKSTLPPWIPKPYIWLDFERFKGEGAAAVIEQKVKEAGGQARHETIEDRAARLKRSRLAEKSRDDFLQSPEAIQLANREVKKIMTTLRQLKSEIEDPATNLYLGFGEQDEDMYEFGYNGFFLRFFLTTPFQYRLNGKLRVSLYEKSGDKPFDYKEKTIEQTSYKFDRNLVGYNGWSDFETGKNFMTTNDLIDIWVKKFIDDIERRKKRN